MKKQKKIKGNYFFLFVVFHIWKCNYVESVAILSLLFKQLAISNEVLDIRKNAQ